MNLKPDTNNNNVLKHISAICNISAFLAAEDVNVIAVDWSAGSGTINYATALSNTIADFINCLNASSGSSAIQYHIIGHGLGGHHAGITARRVNNDVAYVPIDGLYTEVIHTNCGINGYLSDLAQVDFYPNGGESMPGCDSHSCDHARSFFYFAESITSGGFVGRQCINYLAAVLQTCSVLPGRLNMGGLRPKIGSSGVYLLTTNPAPPFSQ